MNVNFFGDKRYNLVTLLRETGICSVASFRFDR